MKRFLGYSNLRQRRAAVWTVVLLASAVFGWPDSGLRRITPTGVKMPLVPGSGTGGGTGGYVVERAAFPGLAFDSPAAIVSAPGEPNRLYVIERAGRVVLIPDLNNPTREIFMDISGRVNSNYRDLENGAEGLTSIAFHPNHAENGYFYVTYTWPSPSGNMNRLSRFQKSSANRGDANSEFVMIEQPDSGYGHNFNEVKFGPDGYLYVAVGDEGDGKGPGDEYGNSQRIDKDFFSAVLRLDVDLKRTSLSANTHPALKGGYKIPADNPYVGATQFNGIPVDPSKVRTEFYAVGFRNPWRLFFDQDGTLYAGDVGRHDREEINIVRKGGNYGWAFREGLSTTSALGQPPGGVRLEAPVLEYPHGYGDFSGFCVIGGVVYRGSKLPELNGAYIFADYATGNIWSMRHNGETSTEWKKIAGLYDVSAFGIDPRNGDVLVCKDKIDGAGGDGIFRLEAKVINETSLIPETLRETGLFQDVGNLTVVPGFVPYEVNVPLWSDGADKRRWFGLPNANAKLQFSPEGNWTFPSGTIWIKHFELELEKGNPASKKRIETRVIVKNESNDGLYGVTYRWGDSLDDAILVPEEGAEETFEIRDGKSTRFQTWRYPSRQECIVCHTPSGGYALGFNTAQLNRDFDYPLSRTNQIIALRDAGYMDGPTNEVHSLRRLADLEETEWSREYRVRSYLAANCANCHNPSGVERARWDGRIHTPLSEAKIVNGELLDAFGDTENRVVTPGDPDRSVLLRRMEFLGQGHMPPLGSSVVHREAVQLIAAWIRDDLADYKSFEEWVAGYDLSDRDRTDDPDGDGASNYLEWLLESHPANGDDGFRASIRMEDGRAVLSFPQKANRGFEVIGSSSITGEWKSVDVPGNAPFFSATNRSATIDFPMPGDQDGFYKVRVYEP